MTDARVPERWLSDRRLLRLSDSNFRAFISALVWAVANRTDGAIETEDLPLIPGFTAGAEKALVASGLWTPSSRGWLIADFADTQTSRAQLLHLEEKRAKEREKKARQRAASKRDTTDGSTSVDAVVPRDIPRDVSGAVPPDDTGQDRTGQDRPRRRAVPTKASPANASPDLEEKRPLVDGKPVWHGAGPDPYDEYR